MAAAIALAIMAPSGEINHSPTVPGAVNPLVTQQNVASTICHPGWTQTQRPQQALTRALKHALLPPGAEARDYELDHCIPLELGGAPLSAANLWLQPWPEARRKDRIENLLHTMVCKGEISLAEAQALVCQHWAEAYERFMP